MATRGKTALALAREFRPTAITLDVILPDMLGWTVLNALKINPETRHIPVQIISVEEERSHALTHGAFSYVVKPTTTEGLEDCFERIKKFVEPRIKRLLVVEDAPPSNRESIVDLLHHEDIEIATAGTGAEALDRLLDRPFDCCVLDLRLPDMTGFQLLDKVQNEPTLREIPIVVFTGKDLSPEEDRQLRTVAKSVLIKDVQSPERLFDETALFLHRVVTNLPEAKQNMLDRLHASTEALRHRKVLVVDDDARNIFALTTMLENQEMDVVTATNGRQAIEMLDQQADINVVLMDIMMPEMDGYQTMQEIRKKPKFSALPIIALTAKAMKRATGINALARRGVGLCGQARQHQRTPLAAARMAVPLTPSNRNAAMNAPISPVPESEVSILLVDDETRNLDVLESVLASPDCRLVRATSADQALGLLLQGEFAAIVLDIQMPQMTGIELANLVKQRKRTQHIPIIFLTAYHLEDADVLEGYGIGAVDYLTKPINPQILKSKVAVFVDLFRKTRALAATNAALEVEVKQRVNAEKALVQANNELEERVQARTADLSRANAELRNREEALRASEAQAMAASRAKDDFFAKLSHELRTPLNPVLLLASEAAQNEELPTGVRADFNTIHRNVYVGGQTDRRSAGPDANFAGEAGVGNASHQRAFQPGRCVEDGPRGNRSPADRAQTSTVRVASGRHR